MELPRKDGKTQLNYEQKDWKLSRESNKRNSIVCVMVASTKETWEKEATSSEKGHWQHGMGVTEGTVSCIS